MGTNAWFRQRGSRQGRIPHDLFAVQTRIIGRVGEILGDETYGRVPPLAADKPETRRVFKSSFAQPPQMWSTHPASADREANAKRHYLAAPHDARSAWVLFDNVDAMKQKVMAHLLGQTEAQPASAEQTLAALDERYKRLRYDARYRGAYLGRPLTRHAKQADELYEKSPPRAYIRQGLNTLYSPQLAEDLARLRDLSEERGTLEALRDRIYRATGGRIVHRGREISRRDLPAAIRDVAREETQVRGRLIAHDRQCRSAHLAAAELLGAGWKEYLCGLIGVLHYAEHRLADLEDAHGLLNNVFAIVTADGKVSSRELKRLIAAAGPVHEVLARIHAQKVDLHLDSSLCARLETATWPAMLEEFTLPPASKENINDWIRVIDGWIRSATGPLTTLAGATLEQLLQAEDDVARHVRERSTPAPACAPSRVPANYSAFVLGQERKRQTRLDLWDRFQTADGLAPALARLVVAGAIVGAVLGFGGIAGTTSTLTIYNGLALSVSVHAADRKAIVAPFSASEIEVKLDEASTIEASTADGTPIEQFKPQIGGHSQHYVYNVAGASPLVEWTASYGSAAEQAPRYLGAPRWLVSSADFFFTEPPKSVKIKGGGATRTVLASPGDQAPAEVLPLLQNDAQRRQVIIAHAKWDRSDARHSGEWQALAK